jgi:hypothetical protein
MQFTQNHRELRRAGSFIRLNEFRRTESSDQRSSAIHRSGEIGELTFVDPRRPLRGETRMAIRNYRCFDS